MHCLDLIHLVITFSPSCMKVLVPTPSTKGRGVEPTPKTVDSANFNFGRRLGLSRRGKKPVELMI